MKKGNGRQWVRPQKVSTAIAYNRGRTGARRLRQMCRFLRPGRNAGSAASFWASTWAVMDKAFGNSSRTSAQAHQCSEVGHAP